ncbi:MAG: helix-turn-helix domain-containing protein [Elusimicrobia bacterium]|nr:helix-turn-helix domain-containing protein [Elusimicrobiota bacterium]
MREALVYAEAAPAEFASWSNHECLRRLRLRCHLNRKQLAAKAGVSASLVGRAEKGADMRLSTLRRLYAALGCRLLTLPAGCLYDLDWLDAHRDDDWITWKRANARYLSRGDCVSGDPTGAGNSGMNGNAIPVVPESVE